MMNCQEIIDTLEKIGVNVVDQNGEFKTTSEVLNEIAMKWEEGKKWKDLRVQ